LLEQFPTKWYNQTVKITAIWLATSISVKQAKSKKWPFAPFMQQLVCINFGASIFGLIAFAFQFSCSKKARDHFSTLDTYWIYIRPTLEPLFELVIFFFFFSRLSAF
jgi:hypothetical protein